MNIFKYTFDSFKHYFKLNIAVVLGIALSTAILLGAFIIGDSIQHSLQKITSNRLGNTTHIVTGGERIFRSQLANDFINEGIDANAIFRANGLVVLNGGKVRINKIQVWGVDEGFNKFANTDSIYSLKNNEAVINSTLADIIEAKVGDVILLRINKISAFPSNTPFVSAEENSIAFRVKIAAIVNAEQIGNFNLYNIQSSPKNVFISKELLNRKLALDDKANVLLVNDVNEKYDLLTELQNSWQLSDLSYKLRLNEELGFSELISERVFVEKDLETIITNEIKKSYPVISYFANEISKGKIVTPYSFIAGVPNSFASIEDNEIIINAWLANDLSAAVGDTINLAYFEVGPLRKLDLADKFFIVKQIVSMKGQWADEMLMPDIPGLTDAGHCRDWETGVPVDLASIRDKDEQYWNDYKGTPKAFINIEVAKSMWTNRFGSSTAIRFASTDTATIRNTILSAISPSAAGYTISSVKENGVKSAQEGVNFGELFIGLSFLVLYAALLLAFLLYKLYLNYRNSEMQILSSLGFSIKRVRQIMLSEYLIITLLGVGVGIPLGILYNNVILNVISTLWIDIVRTNMLETSLNFDSIAIAIAIILGISILFFYRLYKLATQPKQDALATKKVSKTKRNAIIGFALLFISLILLIYVIAFGGDSSLFFVIGFLLLPALIFMLNAFMQSKESSSLLLTSFYQLVSRRFFGNRQKVILIISFLSIGVFLVLSTGLNRKDLVSNADKASSGTGGYHYFIETTLPVLLDMNSDEGVEEFGLDNENVDFVQFRALPGDDASCLNLNKIAQPRVLGFNEQLLDNKQAFTFITKTDELSESNPWLSLNKMLDNNVIPVIADQTVIQWSLGKSVGDTLSLVKESGDTVVLKLIGGLANSIFQGNILISEKHFLECFPSVSGSNVILADGNIDKEELKSSLRNYGPEITSTKERLLTFYQIENTYLNIFLQLGALGLLIGTFGLGIVIFRSLMEQRDVFSVMQAVGYSKRRLMLLITIENMITVGLALFIGALSAVISAIPSLLSNLYGDLIYWAIAIAFIVWITALICTIFAARNILRSSNTKLILKSGIIGKEDILH